LIEINTEQAAKRQNFLRLTALSSVRAMHQTRLRSASSLTQCICSFRFENATVSTTRQLETPKTNAELVGAENRLQTFLVNLARSALNRAICAAIQALSLATLNHLLRLKLTHHIFLGVHSFRDKKSTDKSCGTQH
jgi:C4-dicarboxylate-specific signal transduction histidine kinase